MVCQPGESVVGRYLAILLTNSDFLFELSQLLFHLRVDIPLVIFQYKILSPVNARNDEAVLSVFLLVSEGS